MTDHIHIEKGFPPFKPSESTEIRATYHEFTIPLVGLIVQHGVPYLYWCVVGHAAPESAWAYARLENESDADRLIEADNDNFDEELRRIVDGRVCSFAVASDEGGIVEWVSVDPPSTFNTIYSAGLGELRQKVSEAMTEMEHLMEQFPDLRKAGAFSISPSPAAL